MSIYWAIDERGSITTLPASPFLLPAIFVMAIVAFLPKKIKRVPLVFTPSEHAIRKKRMDYLLARKYSGTATIAELKELSIMQYPCGKGYPPILYI